VGGSGLSEYRKNTGQTTLEGGEGGSGEDRIGKKGHHFLEDDDWTKKIG